MRKRIFRSPFLQMLTWVCLWKWKWSSSVHKLFNGHPLSSSLQAVNSKAKLPLLAGQRQDTHEHRYFYE